MKVLVTRPMTQAGAAAISERFDAVFRAQNTPLTSQEASEALGSYDAVIPTLGDKFDAAAFARGDVRAKIIANFGAGFDHIDLEAAAKAGIVVTNTPDVVTDATADLAITLLLMTARRAGEGERMLRRGEWSGWNPTQLLGRDVSGKVLGVVGMGRIGKAIARRAFHGFGMEIVFFNRSTLSSLEIAARQLPSIDAVMEAADFVVLAVPGGAGTRHLIGAAELHKLGSQGHLINIARGDVVDEAALIEALADGVIAGAGLDVYEREPFVPEALRVLENVTLLPHLGTATQEARTAMALRALENLLAFTQGQPLRDPLAPITVS